MTGVRPTKIVNKLYSMGFSREDVKSHFKAFYLMSEKKAELALKTTDVQNPFIEAQKSPEKQAFTWEFLFVLQGAPIALLRQVP